MQATNTNEESSTQSVPMLPSLTQTIPTDEPEQSIVFEPSLYTHPQDLFSVQVSKEWSATREQDGANFVDNEQELSIDIVLVNTGYALDADSFENMVEIREKVNASEFEEYIQIDRQPLPASNSLLLTSQFSDQGNLKTLISLYQQEGQAILLMDMLLPAELYESYQDILNTITDSIQINAEAASALPLYSYDREKIYSNDYLSIVVPSYWSHKQSKGEYSLLDTITSPDEQAIIQFIIYDDGQPMSRNVAGDLVLALLRNSYTKNVTVLSDEVFTDGREKLTWLSKPLNYQGITSFETQASTMLIVTVIWGDDPDGYYQDLLESVIESYSINSSGGG